MLNVVMPEKLPEKNPQIGKNFWKVAVKVDSLGIKKKLPAPSLWFRAETHVVLY